MCPEASPGGKGLMAIGDLFRRKAASGSPPAPPPVPPARMAQPPGNPGTTKIDREHFLLHAPFQWAAVPGDNPAEFEFRNQTLPEQMIVTVLLAREPFGVAQLQPLSEDLARKRLNALATISNGKAVNSPLRSQAGSGQAETRCFGQDALQKVRFAFVVRAAPAKVVTVALTRYFLEEVGSPFEAYAGTIFDLLQVKTSGSPAGT